MPGQKTIVDGDSKTCTKCGVMKHKNEYSSTRVGILGKCAHCRACVADWHKQDRYRRRWRTPPPMPKRKWCPRCRRTLPGRAFYYNKAHLDGLHGYCRACVSLLNKLKRYSLTIDQYNALLSRAGGRCEICKQPFVRKNEPYVDHCHATGKVRGLLCCHCNFVLGHAEACAGGLGNLMGYLVKHAVINLHSTP